VCVCKGIARVCVCVCVWIFADIHVIPLAGHLVHLCVCVRERVCVCVFASVCVREMERERESVCV